MQTDQLCNSSRISGCASVPLESWSPHATHAAGTGVRIGRYPESGGPLRLGTQVRRPTCYGQSSLLLLYGFARHSPCTDSVVARREQYSGILDDSCVASQTWHPHARIIAEVSTRIRKNQCNSARKVWDVWSRTAELAEPPPARRL